MASIPDAVSTLLGLQRQVPGLQGAPAAWEGRIREGAYTSPRGSRISFDFEDVGREVAKRTAAFEFPGVDGTYVQDNGHGARRYPLRCIFWGDSHDLVASAFEAALLEPGAGKLEHPFYGKFDVVPFGTITRRDDLKTAANQSIIEVTFWTTIGALYPSSQNDPRSEILSALDGFYVAAAQQFDGSSQLATVAARANMKSTILKYMQAASSKLSDVAAVNAAITGEFRDFQQAINFGIDILIGQPLQLAQQICNMVKAPALALAGIRSRLDAYRALAASLLATPEGSGRAYQVALARGALRAANAFQATDLFAMNAVGGSARSTIEHTFSTKPEALSAAEDVIDQLDTVIAWREARFTALGVTDTGESLQALQHAVALVAGYLIEVSFSVVPERRIVLDRARTIVDLAAEIYGSVDDRLDFLIASNALTGDEILELPRGKTILYYRT